MNDTIRFACPQCSHTMKLTVAAAGNPGKCPSCGWVSRFPFACFREPRKPWWKVLLFTHMLVAVVTIGLMPFWKPYLEPLFPADNQPQEQAETITPESELVDMAEELMESLIDGLREDPGEGAPESSEPADWIDPGMMEGVGEDPGEGDFGDLGDAPAEPGDENIKEPLPIALSTIDVKRMYLKKHINGNAVIGFRLNNASDLLLSHVSMDIECFDSDGQTLGGDDASVQNIRSSHNAVLEFNLENATVEEIASWKLVIRDVRIDHGDGKEVSAPSRYKINVVDIAEKDVTHKIRLERRLFGHWKSKDGDFVFSPSGRTCGVSTTDGVTQVFRIEVMARWYYSPEREDDKRGVDVRLHHAETGIGMQWRLVFVAKDKIVAAITSVGKDGVWQELDTTAVQNGLSQWTRRENDDVLDQLKRRLAGHWSAKSGEFFFSSTGNKCSVSTSDGVTQVFRTELMSRRKLESGYDVLLVRFYHDESRKGMEWSFLFGEKNEEGTYQGFLGRLTGLKDGGKWNVINEEGQKMSLQLFTFVDKQTEPE